MERQQEEMSDACRDCCMRCKFYEPRTGFCRKNPPTPVPQYVRDLGIITTAVWPKVPMPLIDWCGQFAEKEDS